MKLEEISVGAVVTLKSGSPPLTVKRIVVGDGAEPQVYCEWFVSGDNVNGHSFHPETLEPNE